MINKDRTTEEVIPLYLNGTSAQRHHRQLQPGIKEQKSQASLHSNVVPCKLMSLRRK